MGFGFLRIILLCPVEVYPPNVRVGALRRQNRVLIWIDGHIPPRVIEFFLTDWMQGTANQFAYLFHRLSPGPDPPLPHAAS